MKKELKSVDNSLLISAANTSLAIFDQQDGKLVSGTIIKKTSTYFSFQCTDGQIRKLDISLLPKNTALIRSELRHTRRLAG